MTTALWKCRSVFGSDDGMPTLFACRICGVPKPLSDFHKDAAKKFGRRYECKQCTGDARRSPAGREKQAAHKRKVQRKDCRKSMLQSARHRAKRDGLPCTIGLSDIVLTECCPIFGVRLAVSDGHPAPTSPSLDKLVPELGYVPDNVWIISHRANKMKNDGTPGEHRQIADSVERAIAERAGGQLGSYDGDLLW